MVHHKDIVRDDRIESHSVRIFLLGPSAAFFVTDR